MVSKKNAKKSHKVTVVAAPVGTATMEPPAVETAPATTLGVVEPPAPGIKFADVLKLRAERDMTSDKGAPGVPLAAFDPLDGAKGIEKIALADLTLLGEANPRVDFSGRRAQMESLVIEGQKEPIHVARLSGVALKYVETLNGKTYHGDTLFVIRGARRTTSIGELHTLALNAGDTIETARWSGVYARRLETISTVKVLANEIQDQIGRKNLTLRIEIARAVKQLSDAGYTYGAIAGMQTPTKSIPWVQQQCRIFELPNNATDGFIQDSILRADRIRAEARNNGTEVPADTPAWTTKEIETAVAAWAIKRGKKPAEKYSASIPDFNEYVAGIMSGNRPTTPNDKKPVKIAEFDKVETYAMSYMDGLHRSIVLATLKSIRGPDCSPLNDYRSVNPAKTEAPATS